MSSSLLKKRVLLIEDDENSALITAEYLRPTYDVVPARDGREGLACIMQLPKPDIIVTDVSMPYISGLELANRLHTIGGEVAKIPIIFLTALGTAKDLVAGMREGATYYLIKPVNLDELLNSIEHALKKLDC